MKTYTQSEIDTMVADCERDIENLVKSEAANLRKSADVSASMEKSASEGSASASVSEASASVPQTQDAAQGGLQKTMSMEAAKAKLNKGADDPVADADSGNGLPSEGSASPAPAADAASPEAAPGSDPAAAAPEAQQAPTEAELCEAYSQLSPDELALHLQAIQKVMGASAASGAAAPPPAAASAAPAGAAPMPGVDSQPVAPAFAKSEDSTLRAQIDALKKSQEEMTGSFLSTLQTLLGKPSYKAVDALDTVVKAETNLVALSKSEITDRLNKAVRGNLAPADRQLVKNFYKGEAGVNDIAHLLKQ